jgi:Fur family ferric uptake transcriptional regulator
MQRRTEQRTFIEEVIRQSDRPLTAQEVHGLTREHLPKVGIATVYRTLNGLVEQGELLPVDLPGEPSRYERANKAHHHHFQCESCRRVFDVPGCAGVHTDHLPAGFQVERHEILYYGTCADCTAEAAHTHGDSAGPCPTCGHS